MGWISYAGKDKTVSSATENGAERQDFCYTLMSYDRNVGLFSRLCIIWLYMYRDTSELEIFDNWLHWQKSSKPNNPGLIQKLQNMWDELEQIFLLNVNKPCNIVVFW